MLDYCCGCGRIQAGGERARQRELLQLLALGPMRWRGSGASRTELSACELDGRSGWGLRVVGGLMYGEEALFRQALE